MALDPGTRLGPYEIQSALGAGGMGDVYKARDLRLDRLVAIKVLRAELAADSQFRERFDREARLISQLDHPHICALYDVGEERGTAYLVMQYLEGVTLAERLRRGALPLDSALMYAIQIVDALDKAHGAGIVHRDLKPGNIILTKAGATLLDFGLAKRHGPSPVVTGLSMAVTQAAPITEFGTIVGTLPYMTPEQLEGAETDARTDIFAFGAILYEMITGTRAFVGNTPPSLIGAILKDSPPPMKTVLPMTPRALDHVVSRCLAKNPEDRWQHARDLLGELKWVAEDIRQVEAPAAHSGRSFIRSVWVAAAIVLAGITALVATRFAQPQAPQVARVVVALEPGERLTDLEYPVLDVSPTGRHIVYVATRGDRQQLFLRAVDEEGGKPLPGTEDAQSPFFSPDGQWVGFFADRRLKKVSISGGAPITLCDAPNPRGASWTVADVIVFAPASNAGLMQVPATGGTPQPLTVLDPIKRENSHRWPHMVAGGRAVLFNVEIAGETNPNLAVQSLDTGERRILAPDGTNGRFVAPGHLMYARAGGIVAVPFDAKRLQVTGDPIAIVESVMQSPATNAAQYAVSGSAWLVYARAASEIAQSRLAWVDRTGRAQPLQAPLRAYLRPRLSPDGRRVVTSFGNDIWIYDITRNSLDRFTNTAFNVFPTWSPDGSRIAFASTVGGTINLFWKPVAAAGAQERLTKAEYQQAPGSWSSDGRYLTFGERHPKTGADIWVMSMTGDRTPRPLVQTPADEFAPEFSPDVRWLAYASNELGRSEIFVQAFPGPGPRWQVSTEGGSQPAWALSGHELYYVNGDAFMAVDVRLQPEFNAGAPALLFRGVAGGSALGPGPSRNFDVTKTDDRFLMVRSDQPPVTQLNVVLNWSEALKRLAVR
jgi:serine/threonine-protein kinase